MKLCHTLFICSAIFFASFNTLASEELPVNSTPMEMLNFLRNAAIKNDSGMAMQTVGGTLLEQMLRTGKIPEDLREKLLNLTAAFEDTYIRQSADGALIYALIDQNGRKVCHQVKFTESSGGVLRITAIIPGGTIPGAKVCLDRFIAGYSSGNYGLFSANLSDSLKNQFPAIPESLQIPGESKVATVKNTASEAIFSVSRLGVSGRIKLLRENDSLFWTITEIDPALTDPMPREQLEKFAPFMQVYKKHISEISGFLVENARNTARIKRNAKLKFYADAKNRAENDPAIKELIGKPAEACQTVIADLTKSNREKDPEYQEKEIIYYENITDPSHAEVEVEIKDVLHGRERHFFLKFNVEAAAEVWITGNEDGKMSDSTSEWTSEVPGEGMFDPSFNEAVELAAAQTAPFFVNGFFDQQIFSDPENRYALFELLTDCNVWKSQTAHHGDVAVTVGNAENSQRAQIIFTRVGRQWKIKSVPSVKPKAKQPAAPPPAINNRDSSAVL